MTLTAKLRSSKRTIIAAVVVVALATGAAWALLHARGVIMGNTISTASAGLVVSTDDFHYSTDITSGLSFGNLIPGGYPAPADGYSIYLRNNGSTDLDLAFTLNRPLVYGEEGDLDGLNVLLTDVSNSTPPKSFALTSLMDGSQPIGTDLAPGAMREYKLQVQATDNSPSDLHIDNVDLAFVGTARDPNDPN